MTYRNMKTILVVLIAILMVGLLFSLFTANWGQPVEVFNSVSLVAVFLVSILVLFVLACAFANIGR